MYGSEAVEKTIEIACLADEVRLLRNENVRLWEEIKAQNGVIRERNVEIKELNGEIAGLMEELESSYQDIDQLLEDYEI